MAGKQAQGLGTRQIQIQDDVHGQPGCEDGVRCGQTVGGVEDFLPHWNPREPGCSVAGRKQNVRGSACFENCETEFRYSRCIRQGGVEAPILWGRVAKYVIWKVEKWKARGWSLSLGKKTTTSTYFEARCGPIIYGLFCHDREVLVHMVNDVIEELMDLDMEPKPESLWWTCSYEEEEEHTLEVSGRGKVWRAHA